MPFSLEKTATAADAASPASQAAFLSPAALAAADVAQQAREHAQRRQFVGAAHDVGDRFGEQGMQRPQGGQQAGPRNVTEQ